MIHLQCSSVHLVMSREVYKVRWLHFTILLLKKMKLTRQLNGLVGGVGLSVKHLFYLQTFAKLCHYLLDLGSFSLLWIRLHSYRGTSDLDRSLPFGTTQCLRPINTWIMLRRHWWDTKIVYICNATEFWWLPILLSPRLCTFDIQKLSDTELWNYNGSRAAIIYTKGYHHIILITLMFCNARHKHDMRIVVNYVGCMNFIRTRSWCFVFVRNFVVEEDQFLHFAFASQPSIFPILNKDSLLLV